MTWPELLKDPTLRDLPYKIELNEWGKIVMSPASNRHGIVQSLILTELARWIRGGFLISECSIQTSKGVKVADVAWASDDFIREHADVTPYDTAPELCVEITSPSNTSGEMDEKKELYFARGAKEVWVCDQEGNVTFCRPGRVVERSALFPGFPRRLKVGLNAAADVQSARAV